MALGLDTAALVAATSLTGKGVTHAHKRNANVLRSHSLQVRVEKLAESCDLTGGNEASP
jgi:hypothetical protein